jgi:hypothetical protein
MTFLASEALSRLPRTSNFFLLFFSSNGFTLGAAWAAVTALGTLPRFFIAAAAEGWW